MEAARSISKTLLGLCVSLRRSATGKALLLAGVLPADMLADVRVSGYGCVDTELDRERIEGSVVPLEGRDSCFIESSSRPAACFARRLRRVCRMPRPYFSDSRSDNMVACYVTLCF